MQQRFSYEEIKAYLDRQDELKLLSSETIEDPLNDHRLEPTRWDLEILTVRLAPTSLKAGDVLAPGAFTHKDFRYTHGQLTDAGVPRRAGKARLGLRRRRELAARTFAHQTDLSWRRSLHGILVSRKKPFILYGLKYLLN